MKVVVVPPATHVRLVVSPPGAGGPLARAVEALARWDAYRAIRVAVAPYGCEEVAGGLIEWAAEGHRLWVRGGRLQTEGACGGGTHGPPRVMEVSGFPKSTTNHGLYNVLLHNLLLD